MTRDNPFNCLSGVCSYLRKIVRGYAILEIKRRSGAVDIPLYSAGNVERSVAYSANDANGIFPDGATRFCHHADNIANGANGIKVITEDPHLARLPPSQEHISDYSLRIRGHIVRL